MSIMNFKGPGVGPVIEIDSDVARIGRMRRRVQAWANALNRVLDKREVDVLGIMLSYADPENDNSSWEPEHIKEFMNRVRNYLKKSLLAYCWVGELQERGTVHYHICLVIEKHQQWPNAKYNPDELLTKEAEFVDLPFFDSLGWWVHGVTHVQFLHNISPYYLTKYVQKGHDTRRGFPKGMRLFACVIRCDIEVQDRFDFRLSALPGYVRAAIRERVSHLLLSWANSFYEGQVFSSLDYLYIDWSWEPLDGGGWMISHREYEKLVQSAYRFIGVDGDYNASVDANDWME